MSKETVNIQQWAQGWQALNTEHVMSKAEIKTAIDETLSTLTLKQKVEQLHGSLKLLEIIQLGWNYGSVPYKMTDTPDSNVPPLYFTDGPRGVTMQGSTCYPVSMARGATFDNNLEERIGDAIGVEARAHGASYYAGVCINLLRHPGWGRAQETYGEDPYHLGNFGAALTRGVQNHIMATIKHFAVNSVDNTRFKVNITIDERTLREIYLPHFKRCIVDENAASVMGAYNKLNGDQCCHHKYLLRDILKDEWGFDGFVSSDWVYGIKDTIAGIEGGCDVEMPNDKFYKKLVKLVEQGKVDEKLIDDAVSRVLRKKMEFATVGQPERYTQAAIGCEAHRALAREAAEKSLVLLKNACPENSSAAILPFKQTSASNIAIIGRLANAENLGDKGSSRVRPDYVITPLQGLQNTVASTTTLIYEEGKKIQRAVEAAKTADKVVLVVGYTDKEEGEYMVIKGGDRKSLTLPKHDEKLILAVSAVNPNTVVVMIGGSAIITENWRDKVAGIVMAWYPGMEGGYAIADVLLGHVNPSGKLPCIFPKSSEQLPPFDVGALEMHYGYYHGYRLLDKEQHIPAFPFGFGLSYTEFSYQNLVIENSDLSQADILKVSFEVTNIGAYDGEEIVQLYIGCRNSKVERFVKELKGFQRISIKQGESKIVNFEVIAKDLAYYCIESSSWVIEATDYQVFVSASSDLSSALSTSFSIAQ